MKWFNNISIRNKLVVVFGLILLCFAIVAVTAYTSVRSIADVQATLFYVEFPHTVELVKFRNSLYRDRLLLTRALSPATLPEQEENMRELGETDRELEGHFQKIISLSREIPGLGTDLQKLSSVLKDYRHTRNTQSIPFIEGGKKKEAQALASVQTDRYLQLIELSYGVSKISELHDVELMKKSEQIARRSHFIIMVVIIGAILISIVATLLLVFSIAGPLKELSAMAERVAYGDLTVDVSTGRRADEMGTLQFMFGMMVASLRQITLEIRSVVEVLSVQVGLEKDTGEKGDVSAELSELGQKLKKLIEEYKV